MLLAGLAGGLVALSCMPQVPRARILVILITSALMGGYLSSSLRRTGRTGRVIPP